MAEIKFKATRKKSQAGGYREIIKSGDLQFDGDPRANDGVWLTLQNGDLVMIDCNYKTGVFNLKFVGSDFEESEM